MPYTTRVRIPRESDMNSGLSPLTVPLCRSLLGMPRASFTEQCLPITDKALRAQIELRNVGPFRATGYHRALDSLEEIFAEVKAEKPDLYAQLGSAGMLCCRKVRGGQAPSNHSWGLAIDLTIGSILDPRGDGTCQQGLLEVYPYFHRHGWYWGCEFHTEDAMHFEVAAETLKAWKGD